MRNQLWRSKGCFLSFEIYPFFVTLLTSSPNTNQGSFKKIKSIFGTYFSRRFNHVQESMNRQAGILKPQIPNFIGKLCPRKYSLEHPFFGTVPQILLPPQKEDYLKSPIISVQMLLSFMVNCHLHFFMRSKATFLCDCIMAIPPQKVFVFGYQSAYISVPSLFVF